MGRVAPNLGAFYPSLRLWDLTARRACKCNGVEGGTG